MSYGQPKLSSLVLHNANGYLGGAFKVTVSSRPNASFLPGVNPDLGGGFKVNDFIAYMHQSSNLKSTPKIGIRTKVSDISHIIVSVLGRALASYCAVLPLHTYQHHVTILLSGTLLLNNTTDQLVVASTRESICQTHLAIGNRR